MAQSLKKGAGLLEPETITWLMDLMQARGVSSFRIRRGEEEIEIHWPELASQPSAVPAVTPSTPAPEPAPTQTLHAITSPAVGTYFASPEPGKPPFVTIGQTIGAGDVVCVVESMKLMNEIEADASGEVVELPIPNGGSVKAGEVVCLIRLDMEE